MVDADGFRPNVGIVLANDRGQVLWARRVGQDAWQFPQGGILSCETPEQALYRELHEEVGLEPRCVEILACTAGWLRYRLPRRLLRHNSEPGFRGQKQKWFLLRMLGDDTEVCMCRSSKPEFDSWRWVSYWYPLGQVVAFKREVYRRALKELAPQMPVCDLEAEAHVSPESAGLPPRALVGGYPAATGDHPALTGDHAGGLGEHPAAPHDDAPLRNGTRRPDAAACAGGSTRAGGTGRAARDADPNAGEHSTPGWVGDLGWSGCTGR